MNDSNPTSLVIIVDVNPERWAVRGNTEKDEYATFDQIIRSVVLFGNSYALMHRDNRLSIIANHPNGSKFVYPPENTNMDTFAPTSHILGFELIQSLIQLYEIEPNTKNDINNKNDHIKKNNVILSFPQALSMGLCIINRDIQKNPNIQPRMLILNITQDIPSTYSPVMNCIFSAQKLGAQVDAIIFSAKASPYLQQACFLTGGIYLHPDDQREHLQLMMTHCLPSNAMRKVLRAPMQKSIDFRASCFCHGKPLHFAYMCTVCLSLFCDDTMDTCMICDTQITKLKDISSMNIR